MHDSLFCSFFLLLFSVFFLLCATISSDLSFNKMIYYDSLLESRPDFHLFKRKYRQKEKESRYFLYYHHIQMLYVLLSLFIIYYVCVFSVCLFSVLMFFTLLISIPFIPRFLFIFIYLYIFIIPSLIIRVNDKNEIVCVILLMVVFLLSFLFLLI
jgi:hypothetical protein